MPYDWQAYKASHPQVYTRVKKLAEARRAAQQPTQLITEAAKQEAIEAGKVVLEKKSGEVIITTPETGAIKRFMASVPWKRRLAIAPPPRVEPPRPPLPTFRPPPEPTPPIRYEPWHKKLRVPTEPVVLPYRPEVARRFELPKAVVPETLLLTGREALEAGIISPAEAKEGITWEIPSLGLAEARRLKIKYPEMKPMFPEERLFETWIRAEKVTAVQRMRQREIARMKMEEIAFHPGMVAAYTLEELGGFAAPITFGFGVAVTGISALIKGKPPTVEIPKTFREQLIGYAYRKAEEKPLFKGIPFQPVAALKAGIPSAFIAAGIGGLGARAVTGVKWAYRGMVGYQAYETIREPSLEKIVGLGLMAGPPLAIAGIKRIPAVKYRISVARATKGMTTKEAFAFKGTMEVSRATGKLKTTPGKLKLDVVKRLTPRERTIVKSYLKKSGDVVGGSVSHRSYGIKTKVHDVDIFSKSPSKAATKLYTQMKEAGVKNIELKISGKSGEMMESSKILIRGKKAIEFHTEAWRTAHPFAQKPVKTPEGIKVIRLTEQLPRKAYGAYEAMRAKDVPHLKAITKGILGIKKRELVGARLFREYKIRKLEIAKAEFYGYRPPPSIAPALFAPMRGIVGIGIGRLPKVVSKMPRPPKAPKIPYKPYKVVAYEPIAYAPYKPITYKPSIPVSPYVSLYRPVRFPIIPYKIPKPTKYEPILPSPKPYKPIKPVEYKPLPPYRPPPYAPYKPISPPPPRPYKPYKPERVVSIIHIPKVPVLGIPELKRKVRKKRKLRVPKYKHRKIVHPFPSLKKLMGI